MRSNGTDGAMKSEAQQRIEKRELFIRDLFLPEEYEMYGFGRSDVDYRYMLSFLCIKDLHSKFRPIANDDQWKQLLDNKWLFYLHYGQLGFPIANTYGMYLPKSGLTVAGKGLGSREQLRQFLEEMRPATLVIKPVGGFMGQKVFVLSEMRYDKGTFTGATNQGETLSFDDLAKAVTAPPDIQFRTGDYELSLPGYILQAKIEQHAFLNELAPYGLNTLRVVTFRDADDEVHVYFATLRVGRRGSSVDNWARGGVAVAVDLATGVLGRGVLKPVRGKSAEWHDVHPDTGARFEGLQLPFWNEVKALCTRATRVAPNLRSVGWDIAITPTGPVIVEGNPDWDLPLVQIHSPGFLTPEVRRQLASLGISLPEGKLPPMKLWDRVVRNVGARLAR